MLSKNFSINDDYKVLLFVKQGFYAETYRVKGNDGKLYFLKLFNYSKLHSSAFNEDNNILEIEFIKSFQHPNLLTYKDSGEVVIENKKYAYLVLDFIAGETLSEKIIRERYASLYDIKNLIIEILEGVKYLHQQVNPIIHNEITLQNVMLDLAQRSPKALIIDFGYAREFLQSSKVFNKEGLSPIFLANECFHNIYSPQSDLFSVGLILYQLVFNSLPWNVDVSKIKGNQSELEEYIVKARKKKIQFPNVSDIIIDFDADITNVIKKALHADTEVRFSSADEFIKALKGEIEMEDPDNIEKVKSEDTSENKVKSQKTKGKGFAAIAGMNKLKAQLQLDVIDALHKPEEYEKYGVTIPNGILLYGPPGCGKTFFAKHFAEEVGFNFMLATPSTLKSRYVNATQENIAKMFEEAEKNAPTIIFIDEINELLPNRDSDAHEMSKSAVNEMLAQMDRTGEKRIFIIGATNYPDLIDPAMLRSGRLDKKFYLSPPDFDARKAMFEMSLKNRPVDFGIDYEQLAKLTENYVSADIEFLVNEASRSALKEQSPISMHVLEEVIKNTKPSVPLHELQKYEKINNKRESKDSKPILETFPNLSTPKLLLRSLQIKDIFGMSDFFSDPETMKMFHGNVGKVVKRDYDTYIQIFKNIEIENKSKSSVFWVITIKDQDDFIGFVRINSYAGSYFEKSHANVGDLINSPEFLVNFDRKNGYEIDFGLLPDYRNKHIMKEALTSVIQFCKSINANPLYAKLNSVKNIASMKTLERHQFKIEVPTIEKEFLNIANADSIIENQQYGFFYKLNQV